MGSSAAERAVTEAVSIEDAVERLHMTVSSFENWKKLLFIPAQIAQTQCLQERLNLHLLALRESVPIRNQRATLLQRRKARIAELQGWRARAVGSF